MIDSPVILLIVFPLAAYGIGSTPVGVVLARMRGVDLRKVGSGNVGATNVGRALGHKWGYVCFFLDVAKGLGPVMVTGAVLRAAADFPTLLHQASWLAVGAGAIAGHVFSFYLGFRGGKGVATALGVVLGIWPYFTYAGLAAFAVWVVVTLTSRYISLGSVAAAVAFLPLFVATNCLALGVELGTLWPLGLFAAAMAALILVRHRSNIKRLLAGTESKIGRTRESPGPAPEADAAACPDPPAEPGREGEA